MLLFAWLLVAGPAPASQPDDSAITNAIRDCRHVEGPVQFRFIVAGQPDKPAIAYACTSKGTTRLLVFSLLPSGQYGLVSDKKDIVGLATHLAVVREKDPTIVHLVTRVVTPEEERVRELACVPRWGDCQVLATTDVRHPGDEDATLREPRGGIIFDERTLSAWDDVVRFDFKLSLSERRRAAMAIRGNKIPFEKGAAREELEADSYDPIPMLAAAIVGPGGKSETLPVANGTLQVQPTIRAGEQLEIDVAKTAVRGVRLRFRKSSGDIALFVSEAHVGFSAAMSWMKAPGVFGAGLLAASTELAHNYDGVAFFQPALETTKITIKPAGDKAAQLYEVMPFSDAPDWTPFEPSEDFGEEVAR
jgi:hypothetical protein